MHVVCAGGNSEIVHKPPVEDDPHRRRPDISRAKQFIGWQPKVGAKSGSHCILVNKSIQVSCDGAK